MAVTVVAVVAVVAVAVARGEELRNVIITGFGEMPYEPAPGWQAGGFFQSDVFPAKVNGEDGAYQTMDVALRTRILVEDPNEKKTSDKSSEEDGVKASATNTKVSEKNNSLDEDKAKEIEEELLTARTRSGLRKLNSQRDTKEKPKPTDTPSVPKSSITISQYHQPRASPPYPASEPGYNNREYFGDLGEGWNLEDAEEILGGRNYNVLTQNPNGYRPKNPPPPPPPREIPPPRLPPSSFFPFPGFGYKPFPPPPYGRSTGRNSRSGYYQGAEPRLREEVVYGHKSLPRVYPYPYYGDYLSGA